MRSAPYRQALEVAWNLRALGLFLLGPAVGLGLGIAIFGMPRQLQIVAGVMFLFSLGMFASLARGEWRRVARGR
ncbi:MAG: hypothetical protein RQ966_07585 [Acetobacteraceae bacterium]|nr:hypothetical protein [Acetobacteraceae bacterium]